MEKMKRPKYTEEKRLDGIQNDYETTFSLQPLERGFGHTIGVALRRILLSNISAIAPFAVCIKGVEHEFQVMKGVVEDVTSIIMNLRKIKFQYDPTVINDDDIIKAELIVNEAGEVTARSMEVINAGIEIVNQRQHIAEIAPGGSLHLEMYLRVGRGFVDSEENKKKHINLSSGAFASKVECKIKNPVFIAMDSNFSPIKKVNYTVQELNTSSTDIEEELKVEIITDGTVTAKQSIQQAAEILYSLFKLIGNIDEMEPSVFVQNEEKKTIEEQDIDINQLNLSVRSLNALKRIGKTKLSEIAAMTEEQLEQTKNLGKKSLDEIKERLKEYGLELSKGDE